MRKSCLKQVYEISPKKHKNWYVKLQNLASASMIKKKKTHFEGKKAIKTLSTTKKKHYHEKKQNTKNTCWED